MNCEELLEYIKKMKENPNYNRIDIHEILIGYLFGRLEVFKEAIEVLLKEAIGRIENENLINKLRKVFE